jgi:phospholipid/cholesterol/gamma-HCH transport system ATP-binding protein
MADGSSPFLECRDVHKRFGDKRVLAGVDLEVRRGETMVVLGASGSGKTVLLKHMNGLIRPDRGEVWIDGRNIVGLEEPELLEVRKKVGMVFQGSALFDSLTLGENVAYPLREHTGWSDERVRARTREVLGLVGLDGSEHLYPAELSGGMKKRAALARALALRPQALLYDEPTTGLDPSMKQRINRLIRDLQRQLGLTSVVVTHDLESAFAVGDRLALLHEGRIRFVGTPEEGRSAAGDDLAAFFGQE